MNDLPTASEASYNTGIQLDADNTLELPVSLAVPLFVVGPNGAGKSGLMLRLYRNNQAKAVRISAHRQNWMDSNAVPFSPKDKIDTERYAKDNDYQPNARWSEWRPSVRAGLVIADLIEADNTLSRTVRGTVATGDLVKASLLAAELPPLGVINELFAGAGIPITLTIAENSSIVASKNDGPLYSIAFLSDGERAALLIAGTVLTAKPGALILVDEPERHLHGSIVTPLLLQLFARRPDCAFVVSTHELSLPVSCANARTVLVRDSFVVNENIDRWDVDVLEPGGDIDDATRESIIGSRRKMLFIEGTQASLDKPLYEILFPGVAIFPRSSCREVEHAVASIRDTKELAWVNAYGIVDQDQLTPERKLELVQKGIFALSVYSVEGLYYHPVIVETIAARQSAMIGTNAKAMVEKAWAELLAAVFDQADRLAARMTEQLVRDRISQAVPNWRQIQAGDKVSIAVDTHALCQAERSQLQNWLATKDVNAIISRYPIRETKAITAIVSALEFKSRAQFEAAVRKLVLEDAAIRAMLLNNFGGLPTVLTG